MSEAPKVSVVIPTYNCAEFLRETLTSVIQQTMADWEAIVVNNFSTDHTAEVVQSFNDPRIKLVNFRNNGVIAASRNEGLKHARSNIIAFLDSDDLWLPQKLEVSLNAMKRCGANLVFHNIKYFGDGLEPVRAPFVANKECRYDEVLFDVNPIGLSTVLVSKGSLDKVSGFKEDSEFIRSEDWDLWLRLLKEKNKVIGIGECLTEYRLHENNASKVIDKALRAQISVLNWHFDRLQDKGIFDFARYRKRRAFFIYSAARSHQQQGERKEALSRLFQTLMSYPMYWRGYAAVVTLFFPFFVSARKQLPSFANK